MQVRHIDQFVRLYEQGSISKAARLVNISQPALTKNLHQMERDVRAKLFERTSQGIRPTIFGDCLYAHVKRVETELSRAQDDIDALSGARKGHVAVGAVPVVARGILPEAISILMRIRPGVTVSVVEKPNSELMPALNRNELDFVIPIIDEYEIDSGLVTKKLFTDDLVVAVRPGHPLTRLKKVTPTDLLVHPWVYPKLATARRRSMDQYFHAAGVASPTVTLESASTSFVIAVVHKSDLVTMLPEGILTEDANAKTLVPIRLDSPLLRRSVGIVHGDTAKLSAAARTLIAQIEKLCLRGSGKKALSSGPGKGIYVINAVRNSPS